MPRLTPMLVVALLTWLTAVSAQTSTHPPLRAPAGQCGFDILVNDAPAKEAKVGDKVTFIASCNALKSNDPKCLAGAPPIHGQNDCHLDGGEADRFEWRNMRANIISKQSCEEGGYKNDHVDVIAEEGGTLMLAVSPTRCGHGVSSIRLTSSIQVKAPPKGKLPTSPPPATCAAPPLPSQAQYTEKRGHSRFISATALKPA